MLIRGKTPLPNLEPELNSDCGPGRIRTFDQAYSCRREHAASARLKSNWAAVSTHSNRSDASRFVYQETILKGLRLILEYCHCCCHAFEAEFSIEGFFARGSVQNDLLMPLRESDESVHDF